MFVIIIYFLAIGHKNAKNKKNDQKRKIEQNNVVEASNEATTKAFISSFCIVKVHNVVCRFWCFHAFIS